MTRALSMVCTLVVLLGVLVDPSDASTVQAYVVVFNDVVVDVDTATDQLESQLMVRSDHRFTTALRGFSAQLSAQQVARIERAPEVAFVSLDRLVSAHGTFVPLRSGEQVPTGVRRVVAATKSQAHAAAAVAVAVLDTGIDLAHPDLHARAGKSCVRKVRTPDDDNGHGTHVAGIVGASNEGAGVVGVAPGTLTYAVKVLDAYGNGTFAQVICGLDWVVAHAGKLGIKVVNLSLSGVGSSDGACGKRDHDALHKAICRVVAEGISVVSAAGNTMTDFASRVPAAYPEVLAVTAISDSDGLPGGSGASPACRMDEPDDGPATFSNFAVAPSEQSHTIAAPGVCIFSTWQGGGYAVGSGTSMAAPHVSGSIALCFGSAVRAGPCANMTPSEVTQHLRSSAAAQPPEYGFDGDPRTPHVGRYMGHLVFAGDY